MATNFPLFMNYRFPVIGSGFIAGITMKGRLLLEDGGDGEFWVYGVNPGGISASAANRDAARAAFSARFHSVVNELAENAPNFEAFKLEIENGFFGTNSDYEKLWLAALKSVREGSVDDPVLSRENGNAKPFIKVEQITMVQTTAGESRESAPIDKNISQEMSFARDEPCPSKAA